MTDEVTCPQCQARAWHVGEVEGRVEYACDSCGIMWIDGDEIDDD